MDSLLENPLILLNQCKITTLSSNNEINKGKILTK